MTNTVRILGSRAREQVPGTSITLHAPGFRGAMTQLGAGDTPGEGHALPFARAAGNAEIMLAAQLSMHLEARPSDDCPELRSRSAVVAHPRLIVPMRNGVAYALLQTDEQGFSSFVYPEARDSSEAVFSLTIAADGATWRALRVLMWPAQQVAGPGAWAAASRWERLRRPHQLQQLGQRGWQIPDWPELARGPVLLLLHGTFGTPHGTFAQWLEDEAFLSVARRYEGRCLAFAHPTLGATLDENLAWLRAHLLALSRPIDVVAHGRGGLLARGLAADNRIPLRRVCQVGAPNNGTALAQEGNLARLLDAQIALLARAPAAVAEPILEGALCMVRFAAMGLRTDLPGLQALVPGSTALRALRAQCVTTPQWFTVGAQFSRPGGHATNLPVDLDDFSSNPNDLCVPSAGCHDPGATPAESLRLAGAEVHHHNYFADRRVQERLDAWLA